MKLSENFSLSEFTKTRRGIDNTPDNSDIENMKRLCNEVLQPFRDGFARGRLRITSGYRSPRLNRAVGGSSTSAHVTGRAGDVVFIDKPNNETTFRNAMIWLKNNNLPIDQAIWETKRYNSGRTVHWMHIGIARKGATPRKQFLRSPAPSPGTRRRYLLFKP
jgi:hypothetical protein